jgi:hypothetical protein
VAAEHHRETIRTLATICGIEVYGTTALLYEAHYDANGFRDECEHVLISSAELVPTTSPDVGRYRRVLDVETLPVSPARHGDVEVDLMTARTVLQLVRRSDGAQMFGVAHAVHRVALPAMQPGQFHLLEVLDCGEFVRVFPDGLDRPGVVFPVTDPKRLLALVSPRT